MDMPVIQLPNGLTMIAATVEEKNGKLFWVNVFPQGQQDAHVIRFDETRDNADLGREYLRGKELVAYRTTLDEGPFDPISAKYRVIDWENYLEKGDNQAAFKRFVDSQKEELLNG